MLARSLYFLSSFTAALLLSLKRPFVTLINVNRLSCRRGTRPRLLLRLAGQVLRAQPSQLLPARIQIFSRSLRLEINLDVYLERIWAFQPELLLR